MEQNIEQENINQPDAKQSRKIPSWLGFVIIAVFVVASFGGVFAYQYYSSQNNNVVIQTVVTSAKQGISTLNKDILLHKLFPNLTFNNGVANLPNESPYDMLKLHLQDSVEGYFINKTEKELLLEVNLDGVPHAGGLYHAYLGLFDANGNLLTPSSFFGGQSGQPNEDPFNFYNDNAQFGGDAGQFGFYDCNGIKYILFVMSGCPNGTCCSDGVTLYKISNGDFVKVQTINWMSLGTGLAANYKMTMSENGIVIKKVPLVSNLGCAETNYKELRWSTNSCNFK